MVLIIDANSVLSTSITKGKAFEVFALNEQAKLMDFIAPEHLSIEIRNNLFEIKMRSRLSEGEFEEILAIVTS